MQMFLWFLITLAVGALGAIFALKIKIPAGGILGAMVAVVILNVLTNGSSQFYSWGKVFVQLSVGALAGCRMGRKELKRLRSIPGPLAIVIATEIVCTLIFGFIISRSCALDKLTSLYLVAPGGLTDIMLIAEEAGVDNASMAVVQLLRVLVFNAMFPPIFCAIVASKKTMPAITESIPKEEPENCLIHNKTLKLLGLFLFAAVGGLLVRMTKIEGGLIIGSMLFSILYSCIVGKSVMPAKLKRCQQMLLGTYVGAGIYLSTLANIKLLLVPVLLVTVNLFVVTFLSAWLVGKTKKLDAMSCLTCSSPGGFAEMLLLADELGGDVSKVAVIHSFRLILVVTVFPVLMRIFSDWI